MKKDYFNIIYIVLFVGITIIRKIQTNKHKTSNRNQDKPSIFEIIFLTLVGIGMISPFFYIFTGWLDIANFQTPRIIQSLGVFLFLIACWLLWKSHADLGKNWTISVERKDDQNLVTSGIYKHVRHPMYTAHLVWAIANILIIPNWIAGPAFLVTSIIFYFYRIPREEKILLDIFDEEYKDYKKKTKLLIPKLL